MVEAGTKFRQSERTAARVVAGKAVVVVIDHKALHTLNIVGTRLWELADGRSAADAAEEIAKEFNVERDQALSDVIRFVTDLHGLGALVLESENV